MLTQVAEGIQVHVSDFMQSNAVVIDGGAGVMLVDPGIRSDEMKDIASELSGSGRDVVAGFSTHPHWDHLLWDTAFGSVPRYGTAVCAAAIESRLADPNFFALAAGMIPPDIVDRVPLDELFGRITGLAAGATQIPWDGPDIRVIEHQAHAPGHAALVIDDRRVLVAGDLLSDVLVPMLNAMAPDPIGDYLAALCLIEQESAEIEVVIPGHGSVGDADELRARIERDRAYVEALRDEREPDDPRIGAAAKPGWEWVTDLHAGQARRLASRDS